MLGKEKHDPQVDYGYDVLSGEDSEACRETEKRLLVVHARYQL